jgi:hypothetical protein
MSHNIDPHDTRSVRRTIATLAAAATIAGALIVALGSGSDARDAIARPTPKAAALTAGTRLDYDRLGPIRVGMTLAQARRASGQPLPYTDSRVTPGCGFADVQPVALGAALGVVGGVIEVIQLRRTPIRVRGGARIGDSLPTLHRRYGGRLRRNLPNPYVRALTRGNHRIVFSVYERRPVDVITAGRRPAIDFNSLCT